MLKPGEKVSKKEAEKALNEFKKELSRLEKEAFGVYKKYQAKIDERKAREIMEKI